MEDKLLSYKNNSCLNDLTFKEEHKNNVLSTIRNGPSAIKKNSIWFKKGLSIAVLSCLLILVVGIVVTKTGIFQTNTNIVAVEQIIEINELKEIPYNFKLPTYIPFEVERVNFTKTYTGPQDFAKDDYRLKKDNLNYYRLDLTYFNPKKEDLGKVMVVSIMNASAMKVIQDGSNSEVQINGNKGKYMFNGAVQMLHWKEDGVYYDITVSVERKDHKDHETPPLSKEEIIKIAESFRPYSP